VTETAEHRNTCDRRITSLKTEFCLKLKNVRIGTRVYAGVIIGLLSIVGGVFLWLANNSLDAVRIVSAMDTEIAHLKDEDAKFDGELKDQREEWLNGQQRLEDKVDGLAESINRFIGSHGPHPSTIDSRSSQPRDIIATIENNPDLQD